MVKKTQHIRETATATVGEKTRIQETTTAPVVGDVRPDGAYKGLLINEGQGTSGYYSREMLESNHSALDARQSFGRHLDDGREPWERDVSELAGVIVGETFTEEVDGKLGVYGYYKPTAKYAELLKDEDIRKAIGLSIFVEGDYYEDDNGNIIIESFDETYPFTSVDLVLKAGRGGKFEESAKVSVGKTPSVVQETGKDDADMPVSIEDIKTALSEAYTEYGDGLVEKITESLKPAPVSEGEQPDVAAAIETAIDAGLTKEQRAIVAETVKAGGKADEVIAAQKALKESIETSIKESLSVNGVVNLDNAETFKYEGYGK